MAIDQKWVFPIAITALLIPIFIIEFIAMSYTKGIFAYPMDDVFIHMAIAKNLSVHAVWGTNPYEFASASSSILYPLMLALVYIFSGPNLIIPFVLNLLSTLQFIITVQQWLKKNNITPGAQLSILLMIEYLIPLPVITVIGMEHSTQILICFLFIYKYSEWVSANAQYDKVEWKIPWQIISLGILTTAIRFEGMFMILVACLILLYYRQFFNGMFLGIISMLPILIFGFYSMYKGSYFFPNPLILKSSFGPMNGLGIVYFLKSGIWDKLFYFRNDKSSVVMERLLLLLPFTFLLFSKRLKENLNLSLILLFTTTTTFLHLSFANTTWFYRYEAYLIAASVPVLSVVIIKELDKITATVKTVFSIILIFLFASPFIIRSNEALSVTSAACKNLYEQDYLAGRFLGKYYDSTAVAINDLGAMSYHTTGKNVDFWGLGNIDVARSKHDGYYNDVFLDSVAIRAKIKIAALPGGRFPLLSTQWTKVATWHIKQNLVIGVPDLCFFAVDTSLTVALKQNLKSFEKSLPANVAVTYN